jgi:hypothetical protein
LGDPFVNNALDQPWLHQVHGDFEDHEQWGQDSPFPIGF